MRIPIAKILLLLMMSMAVLFMGCSRDSSVTNPNPDPFHPVGTIQGALVDRSTGAPIEGAVVSVGLKTATTDELGQFAIKDVPATADYTCQLCDGVFDHYIVTVDLRDADEVCGPSANAACGQFPYPDFAYRQVRVKFTSLNDTFNPLGGDTASNHDTPVDHLVAELEISVGKLSASLAGSLEYCLSVHNRGYNTVTEDCTITAMPSDYETLCTSGDCGDGLDSFNGSKWNTVATADSVAGAFDIGPLMANTEYDLSVSCDGGALVGDDDFWTPSVGAGSAPICVSYADTTEPILKHVTPENGASIGNVTSADVVFTFSEPIAQTALTDPANVSNCGVTARTEVEFEGQVWEGVYEDVAYSLEWQNSVTGLPCNGSTDCDQLQVSLPDLASASIYSVKIEGILDPDEANDDDSLVEDCPDFTDLAGNPFSDGPSNEDCDNDINGDPYCKAEVRIYTITDCDPLAPTSLAALGQPYDFEDDVILDWTSAVCAKAYNIYEQCDQVYNNGTRIDGQQFFLETDVDTDDWQTNVEFIDANDCSDIQLECTYCVRSVGPDLSVSANEICVTVADTEEPNLEQPPTDGSGVTDDGGCDNSDFIAGNCDATELTYCFSEPLDEVASETASNYVINPAAFSANAVTVVSALSECDDNTSFCVALTLSDDMAADDIIESEIRSGASDNICDSGDAIPSSGAGTAASPWTGFFPGGDDTQYVPFDSGGVCVNDGADEDGIDNAEGGDDVVADPDDDGIVSVFSGPNGICNSTAADDDTQIVDNGDDTPDDIVCVDAGDNFLLQTTEGGDDEVVDYLFITISGEDVAENGMDPDFDELDTNNEVH